MIFKFRAKTFQDGLLSASDLKAAFASVGRSISDGEAQGMVSEAPGPVNFTQMVILFAEKMAGGENYNYNYNYNYNFNYNYNHDCNYNYSYNLQLRS